MRIPIAREGLPFFAPPLAAAVLLILTGLLPLAAVGLTLLGLFLLWFFRDPERRPGGDERSVVAPADGRVVRALRLPDDTVELSIFLSPLDVHVNRAPVDGKLVSAEHRPGRFRPAFHDLASHDNEQLLLHIDGDRLPIVMREVTGVLVRRIVLWKKPGDRLERGERIGLMKFGSRVDLVLPAGVRLAVREGDRVRGGESVIAEVSAP